MTAGTSSCTAPNAAGVCPLPALARLAGLQVAQPGVGKLPGWGSRARRPGLSGHSLCPACVAQITIRSGWAGRMRHALACRAAAAQVAVLLFKLQVTKFWHALHIGLPGHPGACIARLVDSLGKDEGMAEVIGSSARQVCADPA